MGLCGATGQRARTRLWVYFGALSADTAADEMFYLALAWAAAHSGDALSAAAVLAAGSVPRVLVMLVGGVVGDRYGLARVATLTLVVRAALMTVFAVLLIPHTPPTVAVLVLLAVGVGLADALHMPAMGGMAGLLAGEGEQATVQGWVSSVTRATGVAATAAGALLLGWHEVSVGWAATALLLVALIAVIGLRRREGARLRVADEEEAGSTVLTMLTAGLKVVRSDRVVMVALLVFTLANFAATAPIILGLPLKGVALGWSGTEYGLAYLGFAVGSALGAASMARVAKRIRLKMHAALVLLIPGGLGLAGLAVADRAWTTGAACLVTGLFFAPAAALLMGEVRERTPASMMGRISSVVQFSIFGLIPVGHVLFGWLVGVMGLRPAGLVMSAVLGATIVVGWAYVRGTGRHGRHGDGQTGGRPRWRKLRLSSSRSSARSILTRVAGT